MGMSQPNRSRRQIAADLSRIDTMDRRGERRDDRSCNDNCEDGQGRVSASSVIPVEIVVHGQHLPKTGINAAAWIRFRIARLSSDQISSLGNHQLVAGLQRLDRGFGFDPRFENGVARKRDAWCIGLRHPVDDHARLGQGIQDNVKGWLCFRGLAESGMVQDHQEAEADETSFHGRFRSLP
jgi:hypothetical protein